MFENIGIDGGSFSHRYMDVTGTIFLVKKTSKTESVGRLGTIPCSGFDFFIFVLLFLLPVSIIPSLNQIERISSISSFTSLPLLSFFPVSENLHKLSFFFLFLVVVFVPSCWSRPRFDVELRGFSFRCCGEFCRSGC